jgi:hypothetical protein
VNDGDDEANLSGQWDDGEAEYQVLSNLLLPAAQGRFDRALQDWDALDTKAMGMVALDGAVIAGLVAVHDTINRLWWIAAVGCVAAAVAMVGSIWPRTVDLGPDLADLPDEMREQPPRDAARSMFNAISSATDGADAILEDKVSLFWIGLGLFALVTRLPPRRALPTVRWDE